MLRANRVVGRRLQGQCARRMSTRNGRNVGKPSPPPPASSSSAVAPKPKAATPPPTPATPAPTPAPVASKAPLPANAGGPPPPVGPGGVKPTPLPPASSSSSSSGMGLGSLLLLSALSAPAGVAVYLKQNPEWNPAVLQGDANWAKFRELVLETPSFGGKSNAITQDKQVVRVSKPSRPVTPAKTPEELSGMITKTNPAAGLPGLPASDPHSVEERAMEPKKPAKAAAEKKTASAKKSEAIVATKEANTTAKKAKKVEAKPEAKPETEAVVAKKDAEPVKTTAPAVEKKVDAAVAKERSELDKLASEAMPEVLGDKVHNQIMSTTKDLVNMLQAEANASAVDVDSNYLQGIHELDSNTLAIRVAQLATEMKHRSKWEAVRLVEALRRMEEDAKSKSAEVLARQHSLHKELVERELRLQEEVLMRKSRDEMEQLKKQYKTDLATNVKEIESSISKSLKEKFEADTKAVETRYAQQLQAKSEALQSTLAKERKQRVEELENYRAELRALNEVLQRTSTYEAFSHQVHKASVAAFALSDRIEAAAPLSAEIKALREFARNDPFIDSALKTLPKKVVDEGAPSVGQLQERFNTVKTVGRRAAMIPEGSGLMGQLFGGALSHLIIPPGGPIEGTDADAVFSRADYALKAGDIEQAVTEMKSLSGLPADVSRDWIEAAESRLAVEQTAKVVKAHISLLAASCS